MKTKQTNGRLGTQNTKVNETLAYLMYEENPKELYPQVHNVNNPMPISSRLSERIGNDPNMIFPLASVPPTFTASAHGHAPSTSSNFLSNSKNGNAPNTANNGNFSNIIRKTPLPPFKLF